MQIPIKQESQTFKGYPIVSAGKIKLEFRCAHENIQVMNGEVFCKDCNGQDITEEEAVSILESYLDSRAAVEEDEVIQDA